MVNGQAGGNRLNTNTGSVHSGCCSRTVASAGILHAQHIVAHKGGVGYMDTKYKPTQQ